MLPLHIAFFVAGLSRPRIVFLGSFRQLPAVVVADTDDKTAPADRAHVRKWYSADPFRGGGVVDDAGRLQNSPRLVRLEVQYRMRPAICELDNALAYPDAPLRTGRDDVSHLPPSK